MARLGKATESEIRRFAAKGQIEAARIIRTDEGFLLAVTVTWQKQEVVMFTARNKPRYWASVDRLVTHVTEVAPTLRTVDLVLALPSGWAARLAELQETPLQ